MTWQPPIRLLARGTQPTRIAGFFVPLYSLVILSVSLYPYLGWRWPNHPVFAFLGYADPYYGSPVDDVLNILAYVPLGASLVLSLRQRLPLLPVLLLAILLPGALSFCVETLQVFLPNRVASNIDIANNTLGAAAGACIAAMLAAKPIMRRLALLRQSVFKEGSLIDYGLVVAGLWFFTQLDPSIPLFGVIVPPHGLPQPFQAPFDDASLFLRTLAALNSALNLITLSLFVTLLLSHRRYMWRGIGLLLGLTLLLKIGMAGMLLKPAALFQWLSWPITAGLAGGLLSLLLLIRLRRRWRAMITAFAVIINLLVGWLWPLRETPFSSLAAFRWHGQQLLNMQGMAHTIADIWPFLLLIFLLRYFLLERRKQDKQWL
jgi:VanZ family protein